MKNLVLFILQVCVWWYMYLKVQVRYQTSRKIQITKEILKLIFWVSAACETSVAL